IFAAAQIITLDADQAVTAVTVTVEHAAFVVHSDFVKVEQVAVAVLSAAALLPNAGMVLNGVVRRGVDRDPGPALVIGSGDIHIPDALKIPILVGGAATIGLVRTKETTSSASGATAYGLGLRCVDNTVARAHIHVAN